MGKPKTSIIWKTSDRRAKRSGIWASGVSIQCTQGTFDASVIKVILGSFGAIRLSTSLYLEMAGRRVKRSEIWALGVSIQCIQGTFDTSVLMVILGSFGAFPIFEKTVSRKRLVVERNGVTFVPQG